MNNFADQFKNIFDAQGQVFEPARSFGVLAAESFEKVARQNYTVMGDYINFAIQAAKVPSEVESVGEIATREFEVAQQFGETLRQRAEEYVSLSETLKEKSEVLVTKETKKATRKKAA